MISRYFARFAVVSLAIAAMASDPAAAQEDAFGLSHAPSALEGSWEVTIKPYNCATGAEAPPLFWVLSYFNFSRGGTLFETTSNPRFLPGQRGPGYGYWDRAGQNTYEAVVQAFIQFNTDPPAVPPNPTYVRGTQRIEQVIELTDADHWQSTAAVIFRDVGGTTVPPSGCARAVATRMP